MTLTASALVDVVLAVLGLEIAGLVVLAGRLRWSVGSLLPNLAAGLFLVLALRVALHGGGIGWIGTLLAAAGIAHAADLRSRVRRRRG